MILLDEIYSLIVMFIAILFGVISLYHLYLSKSKSLYPGVIRLMVVAYLMKAVFYILFIFHHFIINNKIDKELLKLLIYQ
jgi:hypothetical protein